MRTSTTRWIPVLAGDGNPGEVVGIRAGCRDVVWHEFDPEAGNEQAVHRPAVVLSPAAYNGKTGLMICYPLTTRIKAYPFEILLASQSGSTVLADQVKNLDWHARRATRKSEVTDLELR